MRCHKCKSRSIKIVKSIQEDSRIINVGYCRHCKTEYKEIEMRHMLIW